MKTLEDKLIKNILDANESAALLNYKKMICRCKNSKNNIDKIAYFQNYLICINCMLYTLSDKNAMSSRCIYRKRNIFIIKISRENNFESLYELGKQIISFYKNINENEEICTCNHMVNQALDYINQNIDKNLTLEDVAQEIHISKNYLCNIFTRCTKNNFSSYVNNKKIEYAKKLLEDNSKSLTDIAFECGFNSQSYFCSIFKKVEGITPLQYRKSLFK